MSHIVVLFVIIARTVSSGIELKQTLMQWELTSKELSNITAASGRYSGNELFWKRTTGQHMLVEGCMHCRMKVNRRCEMREVGQG